MAEQIKVQVNQEMVSYIESLDYEMSARKDIITFMLGNNMSINTDTFKQYQKEYVEFYSQFNIAKNELFKQYIPEDVRDDNHKWELDYQTGIITIDTVGGCKTCH